MKMHISRSAAASIDKAPAPPEVSIIARLTVGVGVVVTDVDSVKLVMFGTIPIWRQDTIYIYAVGTGSMQAEFM